MAHRVLYRKLRELRSGNPIEFEGTQLIAVNGKEYGGNLQVGDTYYACRNTEQLLTAKEVDLENGWVLPVEDAYLFDLDECVGVELGAVSPRTGELELK